MTIFVLDPVPKHLNKIQEIVKINYSNIRDVFIFDAVKFIGEVMVCIYNEHI